MSSFQSRSQRGCLSMQPSLSSSDPNAGWTHVTSLGTARRFWEYCTEKFCIRLQIHTSWCRGKWAEIKAAVSRLHYNSKAWAAAMNVLTAELHNSSSDHLCFDSYTCQRKGQEYLHSSWNTKHSPLRWGHSLFPRLVLITPGLILTTNLQLSTQF